MPSHSKAIHQYAVQHAISEALGTISVALYVAIVGGLVYQVAMFSGVLN